MSAFDNIGESVVALFVSAGVAVLVFVAAYVGVAFIGARFFIGEASYGVGLAFALPVALLSGGAAFVFSFRKIRSL